MGQESRDPTGAPTTLLERCILWCFSSVYPGHRSDRGDLMILSRLARVLRLDVPAFTEIGGAPDATPQAFTIAAVAAAIGLYRPGTLPGSLVVPALAGIIGLAAASMSMFLMSSLLGGRGTLVAVLRTVGYTAAPLVLLRVPVVKYGALAYVIVLQIVAVRESMRLRTGPAAGAVGVPWLVLFVVPLVYVLAILSK
jgi:hypothetical protein